MSKLLEELRKKREAEGDTLESVTSNSPVTEETETEGGPSILSEVLRGAKEGLANTANTVTLGGYSGMAEALGLTPPSAANDAFMDSATNAATLGLAGAGERYGTAALDTLTQGEGGEMSFDDFLAQRTAERQARMDENKGSALMGDIAGSLAGGAGVAKLGSKVLAAAGKSVPNNVLTRLAAAAGMGGVESAAVEAGKGSDSDTIMDSGLLGALFGTGGQLAGEAIAKGGKAVLSKLGKTADDTSALADAGRVITEGGVSPRASAMPL